MRKVLVSGCLGGAPLRWDASGVDVASPVWERWVAEGRLVPLCPELAAGFPMPRPPAGIVGGSAADVLVGSAAVHEDSGRDVSHMFVDGARRALARAQQSGVALAVLVDGSPTCGTSLVYDGTFSGGMVAGRGVAAELLAGAGIPLFSQYELLEADALLQRLEADEDRV